MKRKRSMSEKENEEIGSLTGIAAGAIAGASLGSVVMPVVGTFAGALAGGIMGSQVGKTIGGAILNALDPSVKQIHVDNDSAAKTDVISQLERLGQLRT